MVGGRALNRRKGPLVLLAATLGIGACAALPPPNSVPVSLQRDSLTSFSVAGRFSLRYEGKNYVGRLVWRHDTGRNELVLSSPLGQGMAEIVSDADGARLTSSDGSTRSAASTDELLQSVLGYPLPLNSLADWLRGHHPAGGNLAADELGRPLRWQHDGWRVDYEYDNDDPRAVPGRLFIEGAGGVQLRLRLDEWSRLAPDDWKK